MVRSAEVYPRLFAFSLFSPILGDAFDFAMRDSAAIPHIS